MDVDLDKGLRALLDEREITAVLHRYTRGVDRCDAAAIKSVYHPDARDRHGDFDGLAPTSPTTSREQSACASSSPAAITSPTSRSSSTATGPSWRPTSWR